MMAEKSDEQNLIHYVNESLRDEEEFHFLRFEFLQRLNIIHLQIDLARMKSKIQQAKKATTNELIDLKTTMRDYTKAIRDYEYLRNKKRLEKLEMRKRKLLLLKYFLTQNDFNDPLQSHYSSFQEADDKIDPLRGIFMRYLPAWLTFSHEEKAARKMEYSEGKAPKEVSVFVDRLVRFIIAVTGGGFLVVPMVLMTLAQSQTKSLVTVSVAVVFFALILSFGIRVSNVETLVSTATYAAVLVVFVGTSTGTATNTGTTLSTK